MMEIEQQYKSSMNKRLQTSSAQNPRGIYRFLQTEVFKVYLKGSDYLNSSATVTGHCLQFLDLNERCKATRGRAF